jgi:hypothetical protein
MLMSNLKTKFTQLSPKKKMLLMAVFGLLFGVVGYLGVRYSMASPIYIQPKDGAQLVNVSGDGNHARYTAYQNVYDVPGGGSLVAPERFGNIVAGNDPSRVQSATVKTCWTFYAMDSRRYSIEILDWGGNQNAVEPGNMGSSTITKCVSQQIGAPSGDVNFFYKFANTGDGSIFVTNVTRSTTNVTLKSTPQGGGGGTGGINPSPQPPQQPANPNVQKLTFPAGELVTTCGYHNVKGHASVCPQNVNDWKYIGLMGSWAGTWDQNRYRGVTHEHDVGYWKWGSFCGVKSHVVGDPALAKFAEPPVHFYLVECPAEYTRSVLESKRALFNRNERWRER